MKTSMYKFVYGLLYLISLLPLRVLYPFSHLSYFILYHIMAYRKPIVMNNLQIAFPEKTQEERVRIAKKFYLNFTDTFIETIKLLSMSDKQLLKRTQADFDEVDALLAKGYSINLMGAHQFNWEFGNLIYSRNLSVPFTGIYMPIRNKILDRIFIKLRGRYGTVLIAAPDFKNAEHEVFRSQHVFGLAADQNPGNPAGAFWLYFFGRAVPFIAGPAKGAVRNNTAVVYVGFHKVKRGYYAFRAKVLAENGASFTPEQLTLMYRDAVENTVRQDPPNYLWSHRRFKWEWNPEFGEVIK
jgi:KDO2-lipid IV(A) lauroyltransferase